MHDEPRPGLAPPEHSPAYQGEPVLITVDGQDFRVRRRADSPGTYDFDWLTGPHPYGFGLSQPGHELTRPELERHIRDFLDQIDPATGYLGD
ncbi:hypothetical protein [Micromonospora siamensis]|uniref:Uncharacterized protein n=1 Tax=Micromonospora siamensis TaxID=299152 RepID=A0A1C5JX65_9ACTN|nr:hypothetical protein [Micromonospora siamensis]SCG75170.1 hypothetical protein GA0074704_5131 [Micromonospora siamensis]